jgi:hypothetical protein
MRLLLTLLLLSLAQDTLAKNSDAASVAFMYGSCRQYEAMKEGDAQDVNEQVKSIICSTYMAGAFDAYSHATTKTCDLTSRNADQLVKTFLHIARNMPDSMRELPTSATVGIILDNCFCGKDPEFLEAVCPLLQTK